MYNLKNLKRDLIMTRREKDRFFRLYLKESDWDTSQAYWTRFKEYEQDESSLMQAISVYSGRKE